jgi:hypothetical protein
MGIIGGAMARRASRFDIAANDGTRHTVIRQPRYIDRPGYGESHHYVEVPGRVTLMTRSGLEVQQQRAGGYRVAGSNRLYRQITDAVPHDVADDD